MRRKRGGRAADTYVTTWAHRDTGEIVVNEHSVGMPPWVRRARAILGEMSTEWRLIGAGWVRRKA